MLQLEFLMHGRAAFNTSHLHFLGENHQSVIKMVAEKTLADYYNQRDRCNFNFEMFAALRKQAHNDMLLHMESQSEDAKMRKFLQRIRAPNLRTAKEMVFSNTA
jgi:hypothetical protein